MIEKELEDLKNLKNITIDQFGQIWISSVKNEKERIATIVLRGRAYLNELNLNETQADEVQAAWKKQLFLLLEKAFIRASID